LRVQVIQAESDAVKGKLEAELKEAFKKIEHPPKANPGVLIMEGVTYAKMANRAMVQLSHGARYRA
jgi:hypothetical protein